MFLRFCLYIESHWGRPVLFWTHWLSFYWQKLLKHFSPLFSLEERGFEQQSFVMMMEFEFSGYCFTVLW